MGREFGGNNSNLVVNASATSSAIKVIGSGNADTITGGGGNDTITGGGGNDTINGGPGSDVLVFAANGASNGADTITFVSGAGGDVMNFANFLPGGSVDQHGGAGNAIVAYTSASNTNANITNKVALYSDPNQNIIDSASEIAGVISGDAFSFTNGGKMILITGDAAASDPARIWFIDSALDGNSSTVTSSDVVLVGTTSGNFDLDTLITSNLGFSVAPAGVAGSPINLALANPTDHVGDITASVSGVPAGWTINQGIDNGDGSWTVQTSDLAALTITSPTNYDGALALQVSESWINADGTTGTAFVTDNVEAYAPGNPIFAISGDDHLTGSSGHDTFVFSQPIGVDIVNNFDVAHDKVDLIAYAGFTGFADVQANLANDANGQAVLTLADGQSITFVGVDAGALTAANFMFDQEPVTNNTTSMVISDGATLPLSGIINNTGTVALDLDRHTYQS